MGSLRLRQVCTGLPYRVLAGDGELFHAGDRVERLRDGTITIHSDKLFNWFFPDEWKRFEPKVIVTLDLNRLREMRAM